MSNLSVISWRENTLYVDDDDDDDVRFELDQHVELDVHSLVHWKLNTLGHITLIPSQQVFAFIPKCCMLSGEETNEPFYSLWFDPNGDQTHYLPHSRRARRPLHHPCDFHWIMKDTGLCYIFFYINLWKFKPVININVIRTYYLELIVICNVLFCSYWMYCCLCMHGSWVSSWSWTYGSWIYNFMCNQCLSPLRLWVRFTLMARCAEIQFVCELR
jgi:hypothetical protein